MSRMLKNEMVLVFLVVLNLIFKLSKLLNFDLNFQKSRISLCYGVPYIVSVFFYILGCIILALSWNLHLYWLY